MAPGAANVAPPSVLAFRFGTFVELAITRGGVPVATVDVIWPDADTAVNAPVPGVPVPMLPGFAAEMYGPTITPLMYWYIPSVVVHVSPFTGVAGADP